ncbi:MAG TPA: hypothetical protein VIW47_12830 [Nitrospiraceae bacterium]
MRHLPVLILLLSVILASGCTSRKDVLDPVSRDLGQDHGAIASYYTREAALSRQQVEELTDRAVLYEGLFGRESDWVTGTKLLVQFYREMALEQDRLAEMHLKLSKKQ